MMLNITTIIICIMCLSIFVLSTVFQPFYLNSLFILLFYNRFGFVVVQAINSRFTGTRTNI